MLCNVGSSGFVYRGREGGRIPESGARGEKKLEKTEGFDVGPSRAWSVDCVLHRYVLHGVVELSRRQLEGVVTTQGAEAGNTEDELSAT